MIKNNKGFSLVEMLLAVAISIMLMGGMLIAIQASTYATRTEEKKVSGQQDVRAVLDMMAMEIGMASYNPTTTTPGTSTIWADPASNSSGQCSVLTSSPAYTSRRGIMESSSTAIMVEADINGDGIIGSTGQPNEVIRYVYDTTNQYITRCTCCTSGSTGGNGQPFLGESPTNIASGNPRGVYVINTALGIPMFTYWDATNTQILESNLTSLDANTKSTAIASIRRIDIKLAVETEDPNANKRQRMIYSTSVVPRNHAINY
ncbi:MAG: prepilin-type N-terminal cleavage/methylation domain-containing protein [Nitrospirae bacterium]|nr:prepilin-type N-terminal cleavage/methylation domain-containing protein [Nitrospirota bacterium]